MNRESLRKLAEETLEVLRTGSYITKSGASVVLRTELDRAARATHLHRPIDFPLTLPEPRFGQPPAITVTNETTGVAAARVVSAGPVCALNFASAKKPGGGFLSGAVAQEEDLTRCSGLYPCLLAQADYYEQNRHANAMYSDHIIYSPAVPFFRDDQLMLLAKPFLCSIITAPAPNASAIERSDTPDVRAALRQCLRERALKVLQVAAAAGEERLVLGAWGCGVFKNAPPDVSEAFDLALQRMAGYFREIVFAVYDHTPEQSNLNAFKARFSHLKPW